MSVSVIPLGLLAVGAWLVWWGLRRRGVLAHLPEGWSSIVGTVVDAGDGAARPARIEYPVPDGRRLRVPGPLTMTFTLGEEVGMMIDPTDPTRARLDRTAQEAAKVVRMLLVIGGVMLLLGVVTAAVLA